MKKLILFCTCLLNISIYSQDVDDQILTSDKNQELKINGLFLILGAIEVDYQYLLNDESGIGVDVLFAFDDETIDINYYVSPYYRQYFGKKYASGFFVEAFGMLNSVEDYTSEYTFDQATDSYYYDYGYNESIVDFALGIGTGVKLLTKRGFIVEVDLGIGRNLFKNDRDFTLIGKGGVNLGYRF
ncbi:hypothetical protein LCGC14_0079140 [marine sediment metagenome]|uniref:DUF3575 domain-containing protein n=1 Tax=marine sediment metagenome TaxID=412755 RepID=A0A0F9YKH6_9ZZZZ|nr:hypothetical protein [Maribacter sp.]HDZ04508.1 hypothetical protein [Maribacter sp.]HEA80864.1 hypothetical protein [Maribacter sp.]